MKVRRLFFFCVVAFRALTPRLSAQPTNHWRRFTKADGLPENSCVSVTLGDSGNPLVRHARSPVVSVFDGYEFTVIPAPGTNRGRIYESPGGQLWTVAAEGLLEFRDGAWTLQRVPEIAEYFRSGRTNEITLRPVRQGIVLIHLSEKSLRLDATDPEHARVEPLPLTTSETTNAAAGTTNASRLELPATFSVRRVFDVQTDAGGATWFATFNGLFRRTRELWESAAPPPAADVLPDNEAPVINSPGLPPGEWKVSRRARNGDEWLGGAQGIAWRHQNSVQLFISTNQIGPEEVFTFAEAADGRVWCGTPHKVWEFDGKNWLPRRGGFEQINALHCGRDGILWVATRNGLFRFTQGAWIANGLTEGLPANDVRHISEDATGRITVETARGWSAFHPEVDPDAPRTYLSRRPDGPVRFREGAVVTLEFHGRDKWKMTASERLLFSYRLDEREWSPFLEQSEMSFNDLPLGKHYFQVRALDRNGNLDPKPARLEFAVIVPWYRETRLVLILSGALAVAVFFAALAVNRHRRLKLSYAEVERKIADRTRELELANRELLHGQKMNALGALSAGIAHDFNNILSIVKGSVQIIEDNPGNPEKIQTRVDRIKTVVQQGAEVVEAMLGFSRSTDQPPAPCDLNAVVADTLKLLGDRFLRETEVRFERDENLPEVAVPRDFVQQILLNFIFNAAEAMERRAPSRPEPDMVNEQRAEAVLGAPTAPPRARKQITLATRLWDELPAELFLTPASAPHYLLISVRDSGSGIAPDIQPRIFEPFFTTKALSTRRGTGLGLSMVYELAKKMDAGLAMESVVGHGSTFTLILPVPDKSELKPNRN